MLDTSKETIKKIIDCYNSNNLEETANLIRSLCSSEDFSVFTLIKELDTMLILHDDGKEKITRFISFSNDASKNYLVLSASRSVEEMRFDAACMLRRVLKGLNDSKPNKCPNITTINKKFDREDKHFACALLMPMKELMRFITKKDEEGKYLYLDENGELPFENINIVADHFGVPFDQCCSRIFNVFDTLKKNKKGNYMIKGCINKKVYKSLKAEYSVQKREEDMKRLVPDHDKHTSILTKHLIDSLHYRSFDRLSDTAKRRILINLTISDSVNEGVIVGNSKVEAEKKALAILNNYIAIGVKVRDGCLIDKSGKSIELSDEQLVVIGEYELYKKALEDGLLVSIAKLSGNFYRFENMSYSEAIRSLTEKDIANFIKDLHAKLFSKLSYKYEEQRGGFYRSGSVTLKGTQVDVPSYRMIPQLMENLSWRILETLKKTLDGNMSNSEYIEEINSCIYQMIRTQPFDDGNKRTSRLLSNILYQEKGLPYVLVPVKEWDNYVDAWSNEKEEMYNSLMERLILESYNHFYGIQSVGNALKVKVDGHKLINANRK